MRRLSSALVALVAVCVLSAVPAHAEFYLMPVCGGCGMPPGTKPAPIAEAQEHGEGHPLAGISYSAAYYESFVVVKTSALSGAQVAYLAAYDGVFAAGSDLDVNLNGARVGSLQSYLATRGTPSLWVSMVDTYRSAFRRLAWMGQVVQLFRYHDGALFSGRINDKTRLIELSPGYRDWFVGSAVGMGLTDEGLTDDTTLEDALKFWSDQRAHVPFQFSGGAL